MADTEGTFEHCAIAGCGGPRVNLWARGKDPWTDCENRYCSRAHAYVGHERDRIVKWFEDYGIPDPVTDSKAIPCEHDVYSWHLCESCAIDQIRAFLKGHES